MRAAYFQRLARYNRWANRRVYAACAALPSDEYFAARAGFFPSLHRTLNHLLVADRIWLGRLEGSPADIRSLDQILFDDLATLTTAREAEDERLLAFVGGLGDGALDHVLSYRNVAGEAKRTPMDVVLGHIFNHQTHHRGHAHAMLSGTAVPPPSLDLVAFYPEDAGDGL